MARDHRTTNINMQPCSTGLKNVKYSLKVLEGLLIYVW